jgi:tetratricopeptide (TPR) repeat protein
MKYLMIKNSNGELMSSKEVEMYYKQAMSFLEQDETMKALEFFDKSLEMDNQYLPAWNDKGVALLELGEYRQALGCFERVTILDPASNMPLYNKGYVLLLLEDYSESVKTFDRFLARYPHKDDFYKFALYLKAKGHYGLKDYEKAHELLVEAVNKDKTFREAREFLILVLNEMGEKK